MGNSPGCAGGSKLITGTLKSRNLFQLNSDAGKWEAGEPWQNRKSERFKAWEGLDSSLLVWRWRCNVMGNAGTLRNWERFLTNNQQRNGNFRPTASRNWILPTTQRSLKIYSPIEPPEKSPVLPHALISACETLNGGLSSAMPHLGSHLQNCEITNEYCFKLFNLWWFVTAAVGSLYSALLSINWE